jgi:hypothetical protein
MAIIFIILAITSCIAAITDIAKPIIEWSPQGWPSWLTIILKVLAIVVLSGLLIFAATCFAICGAALAEPKKN